MTITAALLAAALATAGPATSTSNSNSNSTSNATATATATGELPFAPGEQIDLVIDFLHVRAGEARLSVGQPEGPVWPIFCQGKTGGLASLLDIREHYVSYWDAERRASRGTDLNAIEPGDRHTDRARFDRESGKALVQVLRKGRLTRTTQDVPGDIQDLASVLLALRLAPLRPGDRYELPVFSGKEVFTLRAEVEGDETLETPAGRFDTTRLKVQLGLKDQFRSQRDAHLWLSRDPRHIPVRMTADFAVGSVVVTVSGYRPGGAQAASR
ncbi:DUF3108 domain-containing protein [Anaeromyxobacter diazotrophicus]|uniref:DUF3108 domain-containing protein n=1 Tax=Anaeromyxobacter diazotrophicus TaxID=2590199 RepID=A0A7I9VNH7_9BACT|nr:DUF3108 domain-containing protein [Anaeromyxobacter diazotrophicus]GEJ57966.1 hypothetical protein AMYX_27070 [Anaeromyxobacter diazotrophicus]